MRKVVWPITKESIQRVTDNTLLYTRRPPLKTWEIEKSSDVEEDGGEQEDEIVLLSLEEYDALSIKDKHIYISDLGYYYDFDPELVKPSEYESMSGEEREEYEFEMRQMASEFE